MKFNPKNFRRITSDNRPPFPIRANKNTTLILVKATGDAEYAKDENSKDRIVAQFDEAADLLLWAWAGAWSTDIFVLSKEDLDNYYR
jgi:hypothetical protein